jgi:N6-adenosine-specific RNA methylase IME4
LEHRNTLTWAKTDRHGNPRPGTGRWLRGETEPCLLYTQGQPPFLPANHTTLLTAPVRQHSRKPDAFYQLVEHTSPGSKLELFARQHRPGWTVWGAETDRFDTGKAA